MCHVFYLRILNQSEKFNFKKFFRKVGDQTSNGLVEIFVYTVKAELSAMSFKLTKPILQSTTKKLFRV